METRIRLWALFAAVCSTAVYMRYGLRAQEVSPVLLLAIAAGVFCLAVLCARLHRRGDRAQARPACGPASKNYLGLAFVFTRVYALCFIVLTLISLWAQPSAKEDPRRACWLVKECYGRVTRASENNGRARVHLELESALFVDGSTRKLRGEIVAFARLPASSTHAQAGSTQDVRAQTGPAANGGAQGRGGSAMPGAFGETAHTITLPREGERVALVGELEPLPKGEDRGSFWDYLEDEDVRAVMWQIRKLRVLDPPPKMSEGLTALRTALMEYFAPLGERSQALMGALVFGERGGLTRAEKQEFADVGIIHMMAVSGMHVVIFCGIAFWFLSFSGLGRRLTYPLVCVLLFIFAGLCSWTPSVLRAVFTLYVFVLLSYVRARSAPLDVLLMVACILLFFAPSLIGNAGFLLSFAATAGILLLASPLKQALDFLRVPGFIGGTLAVSLAAQFAVAPILIIFFERLSIVSPLVNCVYVPFILCIQAAGCVVPLLSYLPGGEYAVQLFQMTVDLLFESVSKLSALPGVVADVPRSSWWAVAGYYVLVLCIVKGLECLALRRRENRESLLSARLAGLLGPPEPQRARPADAQEVVPREAELPCAPPHAHAHCQKREESPGQNAA